MGNRNGRAPAGNAPANPNNSVDPLFPAAYVHHLHAGLVRKTEVTLKLQAALDGELGAGRRGRNTTPTALR